MERKKVKSKKRKSLSIFDQSTMREYIYTKEFFNQIRSAIRNIFKEAHKSKEISKVFMVVEREFNHAEFHYRFKLARTK